MKSKEVVLALSGGGARGAYHLGVLQFLDEQNIKVKAICGTSIGSIIGASYASGVTPLEQMKLLNSKDIKSIFSFSWFKKSILKIDMNSKVVDKFLHVKSFEELNIPLHVTAVDLKNGDEVYFNSGNIRTICKASSALIPIFSPVEYEGRCLVDGGTINHMPILPLKEYNLPIIGVNLHPINKENIDKSIFSYIKRTFFLSIYSPSIESIKECDICISTEEIKNYSILSMKNFDELFNMGYNEAKKIIK